MLRPLAKMKTWTVCDEIESLAHLHWLLTWLYTLHCHLAQIHFTSLIYDAEKVTNPIDSTYCSSHRAQYFFVFRLKIYCIQSMLITNTCVFPLSLEWENVYTVCISTEKLLAPPIQNSNIQIIKYLLFWCNIFKTE